MDMFVNCFCLFIEGDLNSLLFVVWLVINVILFLYIFMEFGLGGLVIFKVLK